MTTEEMIQHLESVLDTLRAKPVAMAPEPDPWPTEPLIVATLAGKREVFMRNKYGHYENVTRAAEMGHSTLANIVPVTVVPTAEWEELREVMQVWDGGTFAPVTPTIRALLAATDALGLDA